MPLGNQNEGLVERMKIIVKWYCFESDMLQCCISIPFSINII